MPNTVRFGLRTFLSLALLALIPLSSFAQSTSPFNLPAQPLAESLRAVGAQLNLNVMVSPVLVDGKQAPALKAQVSAKDALTRLLAGTGLEYHFVNDQTVVIREKAVPVKDPPGQAPDGTVQDTRKEDRRKSSQDFRVAQATTGQTQGGVQVDKQDESTKRKPTQLEEIVVTGSRIPTLASAQIQPVRSYTQLDIDQSGKTTVADFLNGLPDVSRTVGEEGIAAQPGQSRVGLHGLPSGTTLVLLDGRRVELGNQGFFDLSNVPLTAVDRVDVLPVGASAIYGADALAGAVNIVLRQRVDGLEANVKVGHIAGADSTDANAAFGKTWERGSVSLIATYQERGQLLGSQREPTSTTNLPPTAPTFAYIFNDCSPGEVFTLDGSNLPGLNAPQAAVPTQITGTPTIAQFAPNAGKVNQCNFWRNYAFVPLTHREGVLATTHLNVTESMDLFSEVLFSHERLQAAQGLLIDASGATLSAQNPYNPFGENVGVSFGYPGSQRNQDESGTYYRPLVGIRGSAFTNWHYEVTAYLSHDSFELKVPNASAAVQAGLDSSNAGTALNPFSAAPGSPQLVQSVVAASALQSAKQVNQIADGQALLRGPLFRLPAGPIQTVIGGEYYEEKQSNESTGTAALSLQRHAYAAFAEARAPILGDSLDGQGGARLALTLAGRYDHTSDYGGKGTWQSGLLWRATESISLRGSYGIAYKAPELAQIEGGIQGLFPSDLFGLVDPLRGNESISSAVVAFGANKTLKPETGNSRVLGVSYSRGTVHGLNASVNYFAVNISNYIAVPDLQTMINNSNLYPGGVIRAPAQNGQPGPITQINDVYFNFGDLSVAGFDADARFTMTTKLGDVTPSLELANIVKWQSALTPGAPSVGYVSQASGGVGWAPRWKGTAAVGWRRDSLSANFSGRYTGRYKDYQDLVTNSNELGNVWIFDLNIRYDAGKHVTTPWLAGMYVSVGAVNLFDKSPPFSNFAAPYDPYIYDIRGRFVYAQLGGKW